MARTFTVCLLLFLVGNASAFVTKSRPFVRSTPSSTLGLIDTAMSDSIAAANSLLVSTIDSDIANISTDQFGLVFAGGIAVMIGSVLSALMVGFMLEKGDLYASVAAESYVQDSDDEAFWKNLSDEEQVKAREVLGKIKASKMGATVPETNSSPVPALRAEVASSTLTSETPAMAAGSVQQSKPTDMFSDYGD